jgi:recombination protein RecA
MPTQSERVRTFLRAVAARGAVIQPASTREATALDTDRSPSWDLARLSGRLTEISGKGASSVLTAAIGLVLDAQRAGEPVAWVTRPDSTFYPPDVADSGVDLAALVVVRLPAGDRAQKAGRVADRLVRSGAFGLVVLDLGADAQLPTPLQGRLVGLAQKHDAAIVCLTEKPDDASSLGSMVSLRAAAVREGDGDGFRCKVRVVKDKRRGPGWTHLESVRGPAGLR